ncbi:5'/3'-nucleotidase SurE [Rickettsiella grylli]|uniref:5'/3'-nucleotidase SurE n=1 Tax=Rickettsiella grylli TaxID=59196 RepID=UPI0008FD7D0B|nr:5'/3'-nucleotidase SurE [Rickettsiella grylli]OJA00358.1 5'/3'-nucleotidase SurE [Rickettsiella grylli]
MKVLISNDDGIHAPGLSILAKALSQIAEVTVVAPDRDRSGASNSLTLQQPLRLRYLDKGMISVQGTPTDCVHLALTGLLTDDKLPDMVVSGINAGANLGEDVFYSGTVAAAMEGRFLGLPAIAFSITGNEPMYYSTAAEVAKRLVTLLHEKPIPSKTILNVNIPDVAFDDLKGYEVTRLGTRHNADRMRPSKDPRGHTIYWIGSSGKENDAGKGTDFYALSQQQVSITPLQLDLTHHTVRSQIENWIANRDAKL